MFNIEDVFKDIKDEGSKLVKDEFVNLFNQAITESDGQVKENTEKVKEWCAALCSGKLNKDEFKTLLEAQKRKMEQYVLTKEIQTRAKLEKLTVGLIELTVKTVLKLRP